MNNKDIEILRNSGWLNETIGELNLAIKTEGCPPLVKPYVDKNNVTQWRVDGITLRYQALQLKSILMLKMTDDEIELTNKNVNNYEELYWYFYSKAEILLHNYANEVSHHKIPSVNMQEARMYLAICSFINGDGIPETWNKCYNKEEAYEHE